MILRGDCLACSRVETCTDTSVERVLSSYTCALFEGVPEPVYLARLTMMQRYGETSAVLVMLNRPQHQEEEET